jgi:hypothetical protein
VLCVEKFVEAAGALSVAGNARFAGNVLSVAGNATRYVPAM